MKPIKFRVWEPVRKEWVEEWSEMMIDALMDIHTSCRVMQFTGLHDRNGKEIYEGDIVKAGWHWDEPHIIEWPSDYYDFVEFGLRDEIEIVGNIYENPELLEGK